jgi:hypothetical protein
VCPVGSRSYLCFRMCRPAARCASALSHCCLLPDLHACVRRQGAWFDCVSSSLSCLKKKKSLHFLFRW